MGSRGQFAKDAALHLRQSWYESRARSYPGEVRIGNLLMLAGGLLLLIGALVRFTPGVFSWFGNLPGDIRIKSGSSRVYLPITSMILISVALTLVANLVATLLRDR